MQRSAAVRRVVVVGPDGRAVGRAVGFLRGPDVAVAGYVGDDERTARLMAEEMLGGVDEVVRLGGDGGLPPPLAPTDA